MMMLASKKKACVAIVLGNHLFDSAFDDDDAVYPAYDFVSLMHAYLRCDERGGRGRRNA